MCQVHQKYLGIFTTLFWATTLPSNAPQPPWQWSPSPFQILGFSDINSIFQHYWIYYSTFNLALRCIAPFSKDYSLALKVHNTLLLRLLLSLQVASNSGTRALPQYFKICSFTCYSVLGVNGLPIRDYWQTVHDIYRQAANNLLLADHWHPKQYSKWNCKFQNMAAMHECLNCLLLAG